VDITTDGWSSLLLRSESHENGLYGTPNGECLTVSDRLRSADLVTGSPSAFDTAE
jgi:hypothetical protein